MRIVHDKVADAIYINIAPVMDDEEKSKGIVTEMKGDYPFNFDFSKDGKLLGIEILDASKNVNIKYLKKLKFETVGERGKKK